MSLGTIGVAGHLYQAPQRRRIRGTIENLSQQNVSRGRDRQQPDCVDMALRAVRRFIRCIHRTVDDICLTAHSATELISWHCRIVRGNHLRIVGNCEIYTSSRIEVPIFSIHAGFADTSASRRQHARRVVLLSLTTPPSAPSHRHKHSAIVDPSPGLSGLHSS